MLSEAKINEKIEIRLSNNTTKIIKLKQITTYGLEGEDVNLIENPLTFYPFHNIISIKKHKMEEL